MSIWSSIEFNAISRDFDYQEYLSMHITGGCPGAPVSEMVYKHLWNIFNTELENTLNKIE